MLALSPVVRPAGELLCLCRCAACHKITHANRQYGVKELKEPKKLKELKSGLGWCSRRLWGLTAAKRIARGVGTIKSQWNDVNL